MTRCALALAALTLAASPFSFGQDLTEQYRPTADKLIDAALPITRATTGWRICATASATG